MSKAAKQSIIILVFLLVLAMGFAGFSLIQKQKVSMDYEALKGDVDVYQAQAQKFKKDATTFKGQVQGAMAERDKIAQQLAKVDERIKGYEKQIDELKAERDQWQTRLETIQNERDQLLVKLQEQPKATTPDNSRELQKLKNQLAQKEDQISELTQKLQDEKTKALTRTTKVTPQVDIDSMTDEYWADVLKGKAGLELELNNLRAEFADSALEIDELKEANANLSLELSRLTNEKEAIEREIKYGKDLADTLSLELARSKSDKKFIVERMEKIQSENDELASQIRNLMSTKIALEKTIVRLTDDKGGLEKKLAETENVIQSKIEEIWQIKRSLNDRMSKAASDATSREIELPPIIVSASGARPGARPEPTIKQKSETNESVGTNANVISVNDDNNFVIIDIGKDRGINIGDVFNIYRETDYVGEIEVIQVREDIAAADIKERSTSIKVGDSVR